MDLLIFVIVLLLLIGLCFDCEPQSPPDRETIFRRSR
jgi:hypothetical protein